MTQPTSIDASASTAAQIIAGVPNTSMAVFHRTGFAAGDPVIWIRTPGGRTIAIVRDVELPRARHEIQADEVHAYEAFQPESGLSGDRAVRAAQSAAECLRQQRVSSVRADRSLALVFVRELEGAGIEVELDLALGIDDRRRKTDREIECMAAAQRVAERAIERTCTLIARAEADASGVLMHESHPLTSERLKAMIDGWLAEQNHDHKGAIVAGGPIGADCHHAGAGELRTGELIIVDIFPRDRATGYHGDCTRTVVHGDVPDACASMHAAVVEAKRAGIAATHVGATGESVHLATIEVIKRHGYSIGPVPEEALQSRSPTGFCSMPHGTGHGLGLELKELPLLDMGGPPLVERDVVTVEPGLYAPGLGGVRLEDMVVVRDGAAQNLNTLHEGLDWSS